MTHVSPSMSLVRSIDLDPFVADADWVALATTPGGVLELGVDSAATGLVYTLVAKDSGGTTLGALGTATVTLVELFDDDSSCSEGADLVLAVGQVRFEPGIAASRFVFRISAVAGLDAAADTLEIWARETFQ